MKKTPRTLLPCPTCGVHGYLDAASGTLSCPACGEIGHTHQVESSATCAHPGICRLVSAAVVAGAALSAGCGQGAVNAYGGWIPFDDIQQNDDADAVGIADSVTATADATDASGE